MKKNTNTKGRSLNMRSMFRCMMEEGYYPTYEHTHIQFDVDDNIAVVEYEEGILSVRLFFSIEEESYGLFLEAANLTMIGTYAVKPAILDDMRTLMFSCEVMCDTLREFRKFMPRAVENLKEALLVHKQEVKKLIFAGQIVEKAVPAADDSMAGTGKRHKLLS